MNLKKLNKKGGSASASRRQDGFTLIEILVVIGIIAVLVTIVLVAINPARQFAQARDTQRNSNVNALLNAIGQYMADNKGDLPPGIDGTVKHIGDGSGEADICDELMPDYLPSLPTDPTSSHDGASLTSCSSYDTDYTVTRDSNSRVTVAAPNTEIQSPDISVTR
jgi:prepilin-type N-terminal cleavage/methylation domain-containing protein